MLDRSRLPSRQRSRRHRLRQVVQALLHHLLLLVPKLPPALQDRALQVGQPGFAGHKPRHGSLPAPSTAAATCPTTAGAAAAATAGPTTGGVSCTAATAAGDSAAGAGPARRWSLEACPALRHLQQLCWAEAAPVQVAGGLQRRQGLQGCQVSACARSGLMSHAHAPMEWRSTHRVCGGGGGHEITRGVGTGHKKHTRAGQALGPPRVRLPGRSPPRTCRAA